MSQLPVFATGNPHKAAQFERLVGMPIDHVAVELDEIQSSNLEEIIEHKVRQAHKIVGRPVFVDDFSFWFDELNGLPGPFIKYFIQGDDALEKLCRLADGLSSRRVTARAYFGYFDGSEVTILFGELKGEIVDHPRGSASYAIGTDFIFTVDGSNGRTRGELPRDHYDELYGILRATDEVTEFLRAQHD